MFSTNAASLNSKLKSLKHELKRSKASVFTLQETHYTTKGKVRLPEFEIFEAIRKGKQKGGTMIGVHKALRPILITELNDPFELVVVEIRIGNREIRVMSGYGPQESWSPEQREPFFQALEEEVVKADLAGKSIIIEADFNSKLGKEFIPNDPHVQDKNGRILADIIRRQNLCVANGLMLCEGTITRKRITTLRTEESVISHVLVSEDLEQKIKSLQIDEKRQHVLTRISKTKNGSEHKESDHNVIETTFNLPWNSKEAPKPEAIFNLKNKICQKIFKKETSKNNKLSKVFEEVEDLDEATERFLKKLNKLLHKCFQKVTVKGQRESKREEKLYERWKYLKNKEDPDSKAEREEVEEELSEEYFNKVKLASRKIDCEEGGNISSEIWKLKKELCPRSRDPPTAMVDNEENLVTDVEKIKEMAAKAYEHRLRNRPMKEGMEDIKQAKENVADKVLEAARTIKTDPWDMDNLDTVLKNLKKNKSRDPHGLINELFKEETAGDDLKKALLNLMNRIKNEQIYPKCLELCNISSIWKLKGPRNRFSSYRGIFRVSIFRAILDRLIYNDEYETIDSNLTDSNVGARKMRNIRDNIFGFNVISNSRKKTHLKKHWTYKFMTLNNVLTLCGCRR
jgi:exonuclease III